jgi:hypothetical protein
MAAAYRYAAGDGPKPDELEMLHRIDRWGVMAVMGRPTLGARETGHMLLCENIVNWYRAREADRDGWAKWEHDNPDKARVLQEALAETLQVRGDGGKSESNR